ncbi:MULTISPECIES: hypothetical protein [unclassified Rubrivivax]|uniref:hypothetical protein n=1 Tax=unclassified Rubrivivax TaxID=2649762 RepID=UPI001E33352F|nr:MULTISPECIES: hypothetical protein [unclassified Rubrivivax]MCC9598376.1 hypothetical protein [Rubrivivax sp. JA1055]MCC9648076.1 hypothetical protein [Rubrivivax sp. JA1029]
MSRTLHVAAAAVAPLCVATFLVSTLAVELLGSAEAIAGVKAAIVAPGLWLLVPAMAALGGSGIRLARTRRDPLVEAKRRRMRLVAANGLLVLVPCALLLDTWASAGRFDTAFFALQGVELLAGSANLALMLSGLRDGRRLAARRRVAAARG